MVPEARHCARPADPHQILLHLQQVASLRPRRPEDQPPAARLPRRPEERLQIPVREKNQRQAQRRSSVVLHLRAASAQRLLPPGQTHLLLCPALSVNDDEYLVLLRGQCGASE